MITASLRRRLVQEETRSGATSFKRHQNSTNPMLSHFGQAVFERTKFEMSVGEAPSSPLSPASFVARHHLRKPRSRNISTSSSCTKQQGSVCSNMAPEQYRSCFNHFYDQCNIRMEARALPCFMLRTPCQEWPDGTDRDLRCSRGCIVALVVQHTSCDDICRTLLSRSL